MAPTPAKSCSSGAPTPAPQPWIQLLNNRFNFINFAIWFLLREIQFIKRHENNCNVF